MNLAQNFDQIIQKGLGTGGITLATKPGVIIQNNLKYVFYGAAIALLIYLVMGGLQLMTSRGDPKAIQGAQAKITNALIGFFIVIFSAILVSVIGKMFGIGIFNTIFG
jgi:hypothetical protein